MPGKDRMGLYSTITQLRILHKVARFFSELNDDNKG